MATRWLACLATVLSCALAWFAVTDQSGYGSIGVEWTVDGANMLGGSLRMLCPFTVGLLMSRVFSPMKVRGTFWLCTVVLLALFHVPYIEGGSPLSWNGVFESVCIIGVFPLVVWMAASGVTTDKVSKRICGFLGDISFPLYIVHYPLMYVFYRWLIKTQRYSLSETWPVALSVVAGSVVLAWLCLRFYDMPVRRWLTRLAGKIKNDGV